MYCTCNVTLRRLRATIVAEQMQYIYIMYKSNIYYIFWGGVCSLRYPACNAHTSYCHQWSVRPYHIFPHYLINSRIFGKKMLLNIKCLFWLSLQHCPKYFSFIRRTEHAIIKKYILVFMQRTPDSCAKYPWFLCKVPLILVQSTPDSCAKYLWLLSYLN
jgi:hypothetical protein